VKDQYVIPPPPVAAIPTAEGGAFPVRRVYCVGRNYAEHAVEMGHDPNREPPFFFQKNPQDLVSDGSFPYPQGSNDVQHELELMVALKSGGRWITAEAAEAHIWGYGVALDMTCRDLQSIAKERGRPWISAKAFYRSAPCGVLSPVAMTGHPRNGAMELRVSGKVRQKGDLAQQIWTVPEIIERLSTEFELAAGDVILTGTPAGVGPLQVGDSLDGSIAGVGQVSVEVVGEQGPPR